MYIDSKDAQPKRAPSGNHFREMRAKYGNDARIFLYHDQPHTIGTDVQLNNDKATCITTLSSLTSIKNFLQALLRARQLLNGIEYDKQRKSVRFSQNSVDRQRMKLLWLSKRISKKSMETFDAKADHEESDRFNIFDPTNDEEFKRLIEIFDGISSYKETNSELKSLYESGVLKQIEDNKVEESFVARATYFAYALEQLFSFGNRQQLMEHEQLEGVKKLEWLLFFEDPDGNEGKAGYEKWFEDNQNVVSKILGGKIQVPESDISLNAKHMHREQQLVQEMQQELEMEQLIEQLKQQLIENHIHGNASLNSIPKSNPNLVISQKKPNSNILGLIQATEDWANTYSVDVNSPFD